MAEDGNHLQTGPLTRRIALQILLEDCYRDGDLDPAKDGTLVGLARALGVETRLARRIARGARRRFAAGELGAAQKFDKQRVYDRAAAMALIDGKLQPREIAILERLRKVIRLPPLHPELSSDAEETPPKPTPSPVRRLTPNRPRPVTPAPLPGGAGGGPTAPSAARPGAAPPSGSGGAVPPEAGATPASGAPSGSSPLSGADPGPQGPFAPLERVAALAEAGRHGEIADLLAAVITSTTAGRALESACRQTLAGALARIENRPDLASALRFLVTIRGLAERVQASWLWALYARAATRVARELSRRGEWNAHAGVARALYDVTGEHAELVAPHRARLLRDALMRRFENRQQEEGWALFYALRALHSAAPQREGVARELGIALGRAFLCADIGEQLGETELLAAARSLLSLARAYPRDLALVRRAVAAAPEVVSVLMRGPADALERYVADLSAIASHWPGHEAVYAGIARACEKLVVGCQVARPKDQNTPAQAMELLRELRRRAPGSKGVADALVMVAAQTGQSLDSATSPGVGAMPLDWLSEEVRPLWQLGEELAALPDDAAVRARITLRVPDDERRLVRAAQGDPLTKPEDATYVVDLLHEIERQMERCSGNYWPGRTDWFRGVVTRIGECADPRLARLAAAICERQCWPEPF